MIGALLLLVLQAASPNLVIRSADRQATVPIVETRVGKALRADLLAPLVPVSVEERQRGHFVLAFPGVEMELVDQVPFVRAGGEVIPLALAPFVQGGRLHVPLQLVAEIAPRLVTGLLYDASRSELRVFAAPVATVVRRTPATPPERPARATRRVIVDAGHGGVDNGMTGPIGTGPRIHEKDITLAVARHLATALRARDVDVVMTRTTDTLIALSDRGRLANEARGDLFVSIHVNAANPRWRQPGVARGFETYFLAEARTEDARRVEQMENEAVRFETGVHAPRHDPLGFIIRDMAQNEHLRESSELAAAIQAHLARVHPGPNRGVKQAGFRVLVTAYMPAVLVEIGFGTNPEEAAFISDPRHQRRLAAAIADAAVGYLHQYERRIGMDSR